ncbi:MAG TPA: alpha/beta hydrolase [Candidatus Krumholzibacteria bacterium]|nr:alpha/beta hydrolase [Candidatus Krumholzibacteria bacterium]HPD70347.1 alpha/beta hydrolase [Candidatus Krumholzibacteria bacterium]HRY39953.1 alpha/beta hydrolase [Candidatus Krumholzibacteria bacterium]
MTAKRLPLSLAALSLPLLLAACGGGGGDVPRDDRGGGDRSASVVRNGAARSPDGVVIRYAAGGSGPAVVLVHCWCGSSDLWSETVADLVRDHSVVALDLAGHGRSGRERVDYTVAAFAGDVLATMDAADVDSAVLVGHSLGGPICLEVARLAPDRVRGVVGVDNLHMVVYPYTPEQLTGFFAPLHADFATAAAGFLRALFPAGVDSALVEQTIARMTMTPPAVGVSAIENLYRHDLAAAARVYRRPLYLVNDDKNPVNLDQWREYGVEPHVTVLHDVGHFPMLTRPGPFRADLRRAIASIEGGGPQSFGAAAKDAQLRAEQAARTAPEDQAR